MEWENAETTIHTISVMVVTWNRVEINQSASDFGVETAQVLGRDS